MPQYGHFEVLLPLTADIDADFETAVFDITRVHYYAIQVSWTNQAAIAGTLSLTSSNDGVVWDAIASSGVTLNNANGTQMWNVTAAGYRFVKMIGDITGGEADFYVTAHSKD